MLYTDDTRIEALAVHLVGNRMKDEPLLLSPGLSPQTGDEELARILTVYFLGGFKGEECYSLSHESDLECNEVYHYACRIFDDPDHFYDHSVALARHLYESGGNPQIKSGEFYVVRFSGCRFGGEPFDAVGLFKSETRDTYLDVSEQDEGLRIAAFRGINVERLDKGCLILASEREQGFVVRVVDNTNRTEARYWTDDFLHVRPRRDNYHHTNNALAMCRSYVTRHLPSEFSVSKADQADLLNETMNYFREQDHFSLDDFSERVIRQPEVAESFVRYKEEYERERDIRIEDEFAISDPAVKRQARNYRSVIKLDRNFHIYVHGSRNLIEQGEDERGRYYKLYYEEEE